MNETWLDRIFNKLGLKVRINPLQNDPKNYHNFASVLQASLNDEVCSHHKKYHGFKLIFLTRVVVVKDTEQYSSVRIYV